MDRLIVQPTLRRRSCWMLRSGMWASSARDQPWPVETTPSRPSRHKPFHPAHRTVTPKLEEPLISLDVQAIQGVVDLSASCDPHLTLDALFAIGFASVPDEKRFDPIGRNGHR